MNNIQETLLFPVRDAEARKQFLFACLIVLAGYFIPLLPFFVLMGYCAKIMRQVIDERKGPSMPEWQGSDWSAMLMDGLRLYGAQLVLMLPLFLLMGCGFLSMMGGSLAMAISSDNSASAAAPVGILFFVVSIGIMMFVGILSLPYGIIIGAVGPHVVKKGTFESAFRFKEWWAILRKGLGQFLVAYVVIMALSFVFIIVMQFALITVVLMCIVPFLMIPHSAYILLISHTMYAQAYVAGSDAATTT